MTAQPKATIKSYFQSGDKPTEAQFADLIDSYADNSAQVSALSVFNTNGILVQTASATFAGRTIQGTTGEISVSAGNGVTNPTISIPTSVVFTGKNIQGGTYVSASLTSPTLTGEVVIPASATGTTQSSNDNSTKIATTAFVQQAVSAAINVKQVTFNRDVSTATGTQTVSGVGFTPRFVEFEFGFISGGNTALLGRGRDDGVNANSWFNASTSFTAGYSGSSSIYGVTTDPNAQLGKVSSFNSDGCVISWTKTGTPTGTLLINAVFFR